MKVQFENCDVDVWKLRQGCVIEAMSNFYHLEMLGVINYLEDDVSVFPLFVKNVVHPDGRWLQSDTVTWPNP